MKYLNKIEYKLVKEQVSDYHTKQLTSPRDAYDWFKHLEDSDREKFIVVCLDVKNKVVCFDIVGIGSVSHVAVSPREIIKSAILSNASGIILIHNHPSGDCMPSPQDEKLTDNMKRACDMFEITVVDHLIVGKGQYYSIADNKRTHIDNTDKLASIMNE